MGISRAYLDSFYLLALIKDEDGEYDVEHMLYQFKSNAYEVLVPYIVLGEVCGVIFRDYESDQDRREKITKMADIITDNKIKWENIQPTESKSFDIMMALRRDEFLDDTDIMILSHVLSDPDSKFFFTPDSKILENMAITDLEKMLRDEGKRNTQLKIRERF